MVCLLYLHLLLISTIHVGKKNQSHRSYGEFSRLLVGLLVNIKFKDKLEKRNLLYRILYTPPTKTLIGDRWKIENPVNESMYFHIEKWWDFPVIM